LEVLAIGEWILPLQNIALWGITVWIAGVLIYRHTRFWRYMYLSDQLVLVFDLLTGGVDFGLLIGGVKLSRGIPEFPSLFATAVPNSADATRSLPGPNSMAVLNLDSPFLTITTHSHHHFPLHHYFPCSSSVVLSWNFSTRCTKKSNRSLRHQLTAPDRLVGKSGLRNCHT
jgi:hypothetical protein